MKCITVNVVVISDPNLLHKSVHVSNVVEYKNKGSKKYGQGRGEEFRLPFNPTMTTEHLVEHDVNLIVKNNPA